MQSCWVRIICTSSRVRYFAGSDIECPRYRYVFTSSRYGPLPVRQAATASSAASFTASTSMPSTWMPGMPQGAPFFDKSWLAEDRSTDVPMPYLLFSITNTTGSFISAARLKLS
ncbi:hypothetical protein GALL_505890 [mine drainage metagenome]|uniref:Uncharacterized protein n=1 Tax=mine drainage metagenome TaxID=410659 RepID=A0A1J5P995_9ZZZZ